MLIYKATTTSHHRLYCFHIGNTKNAGNIFPLIFMCRHTMDRKKKLFG